MDFLEVVEAIEENEDWTLKSDVADIFDSAKSFVAIKFRHFSKDLNVSVYALAKLCFKTKMDYEYFDCFSN